MRARLARVLAVVAGLWRATPRLRAHATILAGGAGTALGTGIVYRPAGVILAGVELVVYGTLFVDVDTLKRG